jgi:dienelactone hydrolase
MGAKDLVALDATGKPRTEGDGYQKDYALAPVRMGYVTLTVEPMAFGERRDTLDMTGQDKSKPCDRAVSLMMMLGRTLAGQRAHDLRSALDFLQTRPEVIGDRIGLMGISGGGQMTLWTAAIEPRFKVAIVSGYFNRFADSILGINHCACNFVPGLARDLDMVDIAAIEAPRPMLIQSGAKDEIFPVQATREAFADLQKIYAQYDAEDRLTLDIFDDGHRWSPTYVESFLKQWL